MKPILYSFRRCPFAIRARMALCAARVEVEIREVRLSDKPLQLLQLSPRGTVPVLHLDCGQVLVESIDIMRWALEQCDPKGWLQCAPAAPEAALIAENDGGFKADLDRYKYADRHPQKTQAQWRAEAERFVVVLEALPLAEQMVLVASVSAIASVHGQAMAWALFLPAEARPCRAVEIMPRGLANNCYRDLCRVLGVGYSRVAARQ